MKLLSRLLAFAVLVTLLAPAGAAQAQIVPLDHFLVYEQTPVAAGYAVKLKGQFDAGFKAANLPAQDHFANPVQKTHSGVTYPINDPWRHHNWYRLVQTTSEPVRVVRYRNQFGDGSVKIQNPAYLLVPADKLSHVGGSQPPVNADHYKCYQVTALVSVPPTPIVGLKDQFQSVTNAGVFSPRYFCVPVVKDHNGTIFPIYNPQQHLVVYDLSPWNFVKGVVTNDQFQTVDFQVQRAVWLAVPTTKLAWAVATPADPVDPIEH